MRKRPGPPRGVRPPGVLPEDQRQAFVEQAALAPPPPRSGARRAAPPPSSSSGHPDLKLRLRPAGEAALEGPVARGETEARWSRLVRTRQSPWGGIQPEAMWGTPPPLWISAPSFLPQAPRAPLERVAKSEGRTPPSAQHGVVAWPPGAPPDGDVPRAARPEGRAASDAGWEGAQEKPGGGQRPRCRAAPGGGSSGHCQRPGAKTQRAQTQHDPGLSRGSEGCGQPGSRRAAAPSPPTPR